MVYFLILAFVSLSGTAFAFDDSAIIAKCDEDWGTDFEMVAYCRKEQREAGQAVDAFRERAESDDNSATILARCDNEWGRDYAMVEYCIEQQSDALESLASVSADVPVDVKDLIMQKCSADWGSDFAMVAYCRDQQIDAWESLQ
ncbi:hypothetical protein [Palleronia rufa]|uniref:hypothetical protein n=1 Tax=Palleronia rufa TaxID=1530186 RepID=UPI0012696027|nr:hypothetical protein [Palleronia rufa]